MLTEKELGIVGHSLGVNVYHAVRTKIKKDKKLPKEFYRNYYCIGDELADGYIHLKDLEDKGVMERWNKFGNLYFSVTDKGKEVFKEEFTKAVK